MFVYVIGAGEKRHKIGISKNVASRLATLQTAHHEPLTLEFAAKVSDAAAVERNAHRRAAERRLSGEWFSVERDVAIALVKAAIRDLDGIPDVAWERFGGWAHSVGDVVECRSAGLEGFPGPHPNVGATYTVSCVYADGGVDVAEINNEEVVFCASMFWPEDLPKTSRAEVDP